MSEEEEKKVLPIIGEQGKDGKGFCASYETFFEKIEGYYGRERIVPTIMLLQAAKSVGVVEGDVLPSSVATGYDIIGNVIYKEIKSEDYFSLDLEKYALNSKSPHLKWKLSKQTLVIFANMCIGGGLVTKRDNKGNPFVEYGGKLHLTFHDIWGDVFGLKSDLRNIHYKVCSEEDKKIKYVRELAKIKDRAEVYWGQYHLIQKKWKEIIELQKEIKLDL